MADEFKPQAPNPQIFPWHQPLLRRFEAAWRSRRIPHAVMLQGAPGLGKRTLSSWLARALLCETPRDSLEFCGECASCHLMHAGTHPDFQWVAPEEDKQQISIDQVRLTCERLSQTSGRHGWKVAVIDPAHQLTPSAANSLLKTLEEPTSNSLLMLVTSRPSALPITIRSRCQQWTIYRPSPVDMSAWLQSSGTAELPGEILDFCSGAPVDAVEYAKSGAFADLNQRMMRAVGDLLTSSADVTQIAQAWNDDRLSERLKWLDFWLCQRARAWIVGSDESITFPMSGAPLPSGPAPLNISAIYDVVDRVRLLRAQLSRTAVQKELAVESLLLELMRAMRPVARISA